MAIDIPTHIIYLVAGFAAGAFLGWGIDRLICGRRLRRMSETYLETSNALAAAHSELFHLRDTADRLETKEDEIRQLNDRIAESGSRQAELETIIENQRHAAEEKSAAFEETRTRMMETFSTLSARALQENNQSFLDLARTAFSRYFDTARTDMENRTRSMHEFVKPLMDNLEKFDREVRAMEQAREKAYGGLSEQVMSLAQTQQDLASQTGKLVQALRLPHVRGRWGEITLKRVVEISGLENQCDFFEQVSAATEDGTLRPDMIVRLPGNRQIVIDAKVPLSAFLDSLEVEPGEQSEQHLKRHAGQVRSHMIKLSQKAYWRTFTPTPEFVILFMPGENFFSAAVSQSPGLIEECAAKGVILATPTTLITLLKTVAYAWRQNAAVDNARAVSELGSTLYTRIYALAEHFNRLGKDLDRCVGSYNKTLGSFERRVLVSARKFREMGAAGNDEQDLQAPEPVDRRARRAQVEVEDDYESTA